MNKLDQLLARKKKNILSIYFTAGFPELNDTNAVISELENSGTDMIEIGIPFSDPIADGPVIQQSNNTALKNGITLRKILDDLKKTSANSKVPRILMGYFNPILQFGVENFCREAKAAGTDGVIIPDLPIPEYKLHYRALFKACGIHVIFLVSPQTSSERLAEIEELSTAFIYAVSSNAVTGRDADFEARTGYFSYLQTRLSKPFLIGFGIKDKTSFENACRYAEGAIIGSAFIKVLKQKKSVVDFISNIREGTGD